MLQGELTRYTDCHCTTACAPLCPQQMRMPDQAFQEGAAVNGAHPHSLALCGWCRVRHLSQISLILTHQRRGTVLLTRDGQNEGGRSPARSLLSPPLPTTKVFLDYTISLGVPGNRSARQSFARPHTLGMTPSAVTCIQGHAETLRALYAM